MNINKMAVRPANEIETKVCIALFEAAGYKFDGREKDRDLRKPAALQCWKSWCGWDYKSTKNKELVSFHDFVWSQAPNHANCLYWYDNELVWSTIESTKKYADVLLVSTRPQLAKQQWVPEVGVECEAKRVGVGFRVEFVRYIPKYIGNVLIVLEHSASKNEDAWNINDFEFRPIQSERDNLIKKLKHDVYLYAISEVDSISMRQSTGEDIASAVIGYLYDSGMLKTSETA